MTGENKAHKYFWVFVIIAAALVFGMIYFTSIIQQNEQENLKAKEAETQQLASELDKEKSNSKQLSEQLDNGISQGIQTLQTENESLKAELEEKNKEIIAFSEEALAYKNFSSLLIAYNNQNFDECKVLKESVNTKYLSGDDLEVFKKISSEIN